MNLSFLNDKTPLEAALYYAGELGWPVFPLHYPIFGENKEAACSCGNAKCDGNVGKHPMTSNGFYAATTEPTQIKTWWARYPNANIGIRTGTKLVVVDLDVKHGGLNKYSEITSLDPALASTLSANTGSGGLHIFATIPPEYGKVDCRTGAWVGVDIRADGGYVVGTPSLHKSGGKYQWLDDNRPLEMVSTDFLEQIKITRGEESFDLLATNDRKIPLGQRNSTLFREAASRRAKDWPIADTIEYLRRRNHDKCDPPLDDDEVVKIVENAYKLPPSFEWNDTGNAVAVKFYFGQDLKYSKALGWLEFNGGVWQLISDIRANWFVGETLKLIRQHAGDFSDEKEREKFLAFVSNSGNDYKKRGALNQLKTDIEIKKIEDMSIDPLEIPCGNGIFDLKTGKFRSSRRSDLVIKRLPVAYNPKAKSPDKWLETLKVWMDGDDELVTYIQRMMGYMLTGDVREDAFFVLYGGGSNGKTTFLNVLYSLFGSFATTMPSEYFLPGGRIAKDQYAANLFGARLAISSETGAYAKLDESLVKSMTGRDIVTAKRVYREPFTFFPTHKVVISTNYRPRVMDDSYGIWRRVHLIPFNVTFTKEQQDKTLPWKLQTELSGILNWALEGAQAWLFKGGLGFPHKVAEATEQYRKDMDTFGDFIADTFEIDEGGRVKISSAYPMYIAWASENRVSPRLRKQEFLEKMRRREGIEEGAVKGVRVFRGISEKRQLVLDE